MESDFKKYKKTEQDFLLCPGTYIFQVLSYCHLRDQSSKPFDFNRDLIPGFNPWFLSFMAECHAFGCTGQYDVSLLQVHVFRCITDDLLAVEYHVIRVGILPALTIHTAADPQLVGIFDFIFRHDVWTERAEPIQ